MQDKDSYLGIILNTNETLSDFLKNVWRKAYWETCPYASVRFGLGRDIHEKVTLKHYQNVGEQN